MGKRRGDQSIGTPRTRRRAVAIGFGLAVGGGSFGGRDRAATYAAPPRQATPMASGVGRQAEAILAIARDTMEQQDLKAVILRVTIDGEELVTAALGESMTGVPATTDMRFRNGNVAIAYMATLLLRLVDQNTVALDDPLAAWLPDVPDADDVT